MNLVGTVLAGRYEIVQEVGSGGMAIVYKAKCRILNRYVAIKVLRTDLKDDGEFVRRFNIEAQSAASLTHPNIVSIYDVGTEGELHYIVMEYVEGITLKEYIDKNVLLNWHEAVGYAIQIASGLEIAHRNSIVHRDIKPHNIIMTNDGGLKITDFGIARASMQSTVTCEDNAIGSVHYVSPEQARGGYVDERSDIYSLGIVLYEMLTGKVPFDNESPVSIALMHLQTQPTPPREHNISIPKAVEDIVLKAMSKEVAGRYKTVTEFKNELIAVAESSIPVTPPPAPPEEKTEIDDLGGTAIFTAAKDVNIPYANNQEPSASSNLTPPVKSEDEPAPDVDLIEYEDENEEDDEMPAKKSNKKDKGNKINLIVIISAFIASALIIWGVISLVNPYISQIFGERQTTVEIPQFINMDAEEIDSKYGDNEYFYFVTEYEENKNKPDGIVIDQNPSPETEQVFRGEKIRVLLTVNKIKSEPEKEDKDEDNDTKEPLKQYVGKKYSSVKDELAELYKSVRVVERYDDSVPKGQILSQSVPKGETLEKGETLTITVSTDKKPESDNETTEKKDDKKEPEKTNDKTTTDNTPQQANRKRLTVYGPNDKDSALVEVKVNGKTIKSIELARGASDVVTIQSTLPTVTAEIYHDGKLILTQTVNMTD